MDRHWQQLATTFERIASLYLDAEMVVGNIAGRHPSVSVPDVCDGEVSQATTRLHESAAGLQSTQYEAVPNTQDTAQAVEAEVLTAVRIERSWRLQYNAVM